MVKGSRIYKGPRFGGTLCACGTGVEIFNANTITPSGLEDSKLDWDLVYGHAKTGFEQGLEQRSPHQQCPSCFTLVDDPFVYRQCSSCMISRSHVIQ